MVEAALMPMVKATVFCSIEELGSEWTAPLVGGAATALV